MVRGPWPSQQTTGTARAGLVSRFSSNQVPGARKLHSKLTDTNSIHFNRSQLTGHPYLVGFVRPARPAPPSWPQNRLSCKTCHFWVLADGAKHREGRPCETWELRGSVSHLMQVEISQCSW